MQPSEYGVHKTLECGIALIIFAVFMGGLDIYAILINALCSWVRSGLWAGFAFGLLAGALAIAVASSNPYSKGLHIAALVFAALALAMHIVNVVLVCIGTNNEYSTSILVTWCLACRVVDVFECLIAASLVIIDAVLLGALCKTDISKVSDVQQPSDKTKTDSKA